MCTIAFSNTPNTLPMLADIIRTRGRDGFGFITDKMAKPVKTSKYCAFVRNLLGIDYNWILMHSRATPETEPDYLKPNIDNLQPVVINERYIYAFHGLINNTNEFIDENTVDTLLFKPLLNNVEDIIDLKNRLEKLRGSFLVFLIDKLKGVLYVGVNFLSVFYNGNSITSVPIDDFSIPLDANSVYAFDLSTLRFLGKVKLNSSTSGWTVICSSGLDSTTVASLVKVLYPNDRILLVHYTYGQDAENIERNAVEKIAEYLNVDLTVIDAKELFATIDSSSLLLKSNIANIETLEDMERDVHYVAMRNSIFIITAAGLCEKYGLANLALGVNLTEGLVYSDNGNRWFYSMRELLKTAGKQEIKLHAPLLNLLKKEIIQLGCLAGAPYHLTVSCYHPVDGKACGKCGSCGNRLRAWLSAGIKDPIEYADYPFNEKELERWQTLPIYSPRIHKEKLIERIKAWHVDI